MEKVLIWGTAKNPPNLLEELLKRYEILGWVDGNRARQHKLQDGYEVFAPEEIGAMAYDKLIIGTASCFANRAILATCRTLGIPDEKIVTQYTMRTEQVPIRDILALQYGVGRERCFENFARMNLLIQYAFVEQYYGKNKLGYQLSAKYARRAYVAGEDKNHEERFFSLIKSVEQDGFAEESYISLNKSGYLIDGTHRLACLLYHQCEYVKTDIFHSDWDLETGGARTLAWLLAEIDLQEDEQQLLRELYEKLCRQLGIENHVESRGEVNLWEQKNVR